MATHGKAISLTEKLNNNNYDNCVFKLEMILIKDDLLKYVTSDLPSTPDDSCRKNDAKTRGTIICIEDSQVVHVKKS